MAIKPAPLVTAAPAEGYKSVINRKLKALQRLNETNVKGKYDKEIKKLKADIEALKKASKTHKYSSQKTETSSLDPLLVPVEDIENYVSLLEDKEKKVSFQRVADAIRAQVAVVNKARAKYEMLVKNIPKVVYEENKW